MVMFMTEEELVKWACSCSRIKEKDLRKLLPGIKVHCALQQVSVQQYVEELVKLSNAGINTASAGKALRRTMIKMQETNTEIGGVI